MEPAGLLASARLFPVLSGRKAISVTGAMYIDVQSMSRSSFEGVQSELKMNHVYVDARPDREHSHSK